MRVIFGVMGRDRSEVGCWWWLIVGIACVDLTRVMMGSKAVGLRLG